MKSYPMIEDVMYNYIYSRLQLNGLFHDAIERKDWRALFVMAASVCVGIKEATGHNDGPLVNSIQRSVDGKVSPDEYWCMDFVQTCRLFVERLTGIVSPLKYTQGCADLWAWVRKYRPDLIVKDIPLPGAIAILKHANGGGHTKIVIACDGEVSHCVDGNTTGSLAPTKGATGKLDRNGNGVYYTAMKHRNNPELVGYIKPL